MPQKVTALESSESSGSAGGLSADLKPVQLSALKAYKYDPAKREFTGMTQNGALHIHGDVSPEQVAKFEANPSKGKAWNELRQNSAPVAKVVNGKRVSTIPPDPCKQPRRMI